MFYSMHRLGKFFFVFWMQNCASRNNFIEIRVVSIRKVGPKCWWYEGKQCGGHLQRGFSPNPKKNLEPSSIVISMIYKIYTFEIYVCGDLASMHENYLEELSVVRISNIIDGLYIFFSTHTFTVSIS